MTGLQDNQHDPTDPICRCKRAKGDGRIITISAPCPEHGTATGLDATRRRYSTIVADPPWKIERSFGGAGWAKGDRERPTMPYPMMELDDIAALPVSDMAARDAHLYLWTVQAYLPQTYEIAKAWGFRPVSALVWCKPPGGFVGGAFYPNTEFALFCRRGTLATQQKVNTQWFQWPRGEHSAKPEAFMDIVEATSPGPYLEMFSRRARLGWDTWGNESLHGGEAA